MPIIFQQFWHLFLNYIVPKLPLRYGIHVMPHHSHSHSPPNTRNNPIEGGDNIVLEENVD